MGSSHALPAPSVFWSCLLGTGTAPKAASLPFCQTPTGLGAAGDAAGFLGRGRGPGHDAGWLHAACPRHSQGVGCHEPSYR